MSRAPARSLPAVRRLPTRAGECSGRHAPRSRRRPIGLHESYQSGLPIHTPRAAPHQALPGCRCSSPEPTCNLKPRGSKDPTSNVRPKRKSKRKHVKGKSQLKSQPMLGLSNARGLMRCGMLHPLSTMLRAVAAPSSHSVSPSHTSSRVYIYSRFG